MTVSSLSQHNRGAIDGCSQRQIATRLNVSTSTINYELRRVFPYDPIKVQYDANTMRKHCGRHYTINNVKRTIIEHYLKLMWLPEEIANHFHFCTTSIYKWIYKGIVDFQALRKTNVISVNTSNVDIYQLPIALKNDRRSLMKEKNLAIGKLIRYYFHVVNLKAV